MATTRTTWRILLDGDQPQSVFLSGHFHRPSDGACSQQKFPKTNDCFPNEFQLNNAPLIMPPPPAPQPSPLSNSRPGRRAANPPPRRPTPRAAPTPSAPASEPMASATGSGWAATRAALVRGRTPIPEHVKSRSLWQSYMSLSGNARIVFGLALGAVGIAGILWDRQVTEDEPKGEQEQKPLINVRMVDRPGK
ncbi:hypothetical protein J008_03297 [Cryptococcus neoformans]|nr:hypothetical protein C362_02911 [Cryptococcus neoformans var. grubii Bt1]OXG25386.1 hypothetical protein C367_03208 [Cryptococcus neoformans var. grubii Ze90-1]OXH32423.1 hypothetical protein J008_03297 [Cryptococcus neoformans var. grubii]